MKLKEINSEQRQLQKDDYKRKDIQPPQTTPNKLLRSNGKTQKSNIHSINKITKPQIGKPKQKTVNHEKKSVNQYQNDQQIQLKSTASKTGNNQNENMFNNTVKLSHIQRFSDEYLDIKQDTVKHLYQTQKKTMKINEDQNLLRMSSEINNIINSTHYNQNIIKSENKSLQFRNHSEVKHLPSVNQQKFNITGLLKLNKQHGSKQIQQSKLEDKETSFLLDMSKEELPLQFVDKFIETTQKAPKIHQNVQNQWSQDERQSVTIINDENQRQYIQKQSIERNLPTQSRNQVIYQTQCHSDINTTQKIIYTCNNNSQFGDDYIGSYLPLQSIDNNQPLISSPRIPSKILEMPLQTLIFSPATLIHQANQQQQSIHSSSDISHKNLHTPMLMTQKMQAQQSDFTNLDDPQLLKNNNLLLQEQIQVFDMFTSNANLKQQKAERQQNQGPQFKNEECRQIFLQNKNSLTSAAVQLSEIQTQGDLHKPNQSSKYIDNLISQYSPNTLQRLKQQQSRNIPQVSEKISMLQRQNVLSSNYNSMKSQSENFETESEEKYKIYKKDKSQQKFHPLIKNQVREYDSNNFHSERVGGTEAQTQRLHALSSLDSQGDLMTNQNSNMKNGVTIIDLNLRLTNLKEISSNIFSENKFLRSIDLRNNKLKDLPQSMTNLPSLKKLRLDYNYFIELPKEIGNLQRLEFLSVSQNRISILPDSIYDGLSSLEVLMLNDNTLTHLDSKLSNLTSLKTLLVHGNPLTEIPLSLSDINDLQELGLDWFIYADAFKTMAKHQKGDHGKIAIFEFQMFLKAMQSTCIMNKIENDQAHFTHFLMYYHKVHELRNIQIISFTQKKRSIFHQMALNGQLYLFQDLMTNFSEVFFDINKLDLDDSTPFILAIRNKRKDFVKALLKYPQTNINRASLKYGHPLHLAIKSHEFKLALQLLKGFQLSHHRHLDVNCTSEDGNNSLHFLFSNFYIKPDICGEIAKQLIKKGININLKNKNGYSPLHIAIIGGQVAALQYALNHNQLQKSLGNTHQTFNFNLQGGKLNQNCLYLAIQQNNIKIITTLLFSDEQLNFIQVDDEGRLPKDICPYNSPVYKLLVQYELKHIQSTYNQVQKQQNQINGKQQDVVQFYFNKRHYESPNKIRERILERAQTENQKSKRKQNNHSAFRGRSVVNTCKNSNQQQREGLFTETKGFSNANRKHSRVMSQYHRSSMDRIRYLDDQNSSILQDEAEFSRFDRRSPLSGKMSANFSVTSLISKQQKPSMTPLLQKEVSLDFIICDDNLNIQQENKQTNRHNKIKIQSIISSVDSQLTRTLLVNNFRQSVQVNQKDLQFESPMQSQSNIFQSQKKKQTCQTIQNQNAEAHQINIQEAVQVEEDDDANVPEEEVEDNQDFQKPQMRQFAKSPSQKAFYGGGSDSYQVDTLKLTKTILDQVETWRKKSISYNRFSINPQSIIIGEDYKTIPTQELIYCLSQPNFHSNSNQVLSDEQNIQQQLSEMSQIYQVLDESNIGIQPPGDSTNKNPKLCVNLLQQTTQKCNIMQISKQQNHQYIQEFYILISKGLVEQSLKFLEKQINQKNCLIITDLCYMLGNILEKKDILSQLKNYYCIYDLDQMCSRRFNDFVLYELINRFSQRLFDEKHKTKVKIKYESKCQLNIFNNQYELQGSEYNTIRNSVKRSPSMIQLTIQEAQLKQKNNIINPIDFIKQDNNLKEQFYSNIQCQQEMQIPDFKQVINNRQSVDQNIQQKQIYQYQPIQKLSQNYKGARILQQVKQPLKEREKQYIESLQQSQQQQVNQTSSINTTITMLSKKDSLSQFQQNYHNLVQKGVLQIQVQHQTQKSDIGKYQRQNSKKQITPSQHNLHQSTLKQNNQQFNLTQKLQLNQNSVKKSAQNKQRKQSSISSVKYQQTFTNTPASMKLMNYSITKQMRSTDKKLKIKDKQKQNMLLTLTDRSLHKLAQQNINHLNNKHQNLRQQVNNSSRNSSGQVFLTEESLNTLTHRQVQNQILDNDEDELTPHQCYKHNQMSEPFKRRQHTDSFMQALRQSGLYIQVFNQEHENQLEAMQEQLRIKDKWEVLKDCHTQKMDKVQESAIKRKNMFSSHTIKHQQKRSSQNLEKQNAQLIYSQNLMDRRLQELNPQYYHERSSIANINKKFNNLFRNSDVTPSTQCHSRMQKVVKYQDNCQESDIQIESFTERISSPPNKFQLMRKNL